MPQDSNVKKLKKQKRNLVIGIDPGTGVSSPMGFAAFDSETKNILFTTEFWTRHKLLEHRIRDISEQFELMLEGAMPEAGDQVYIEYFVMRGKGGETLQRMVGSIMGRTPYVMTLDHVQNTSVKLIVGGDGRADKVDVAKGLRDFFSKEPNRSHVQKLIVEEKWDQLDALAIAVAGWHRSLVRTSKTSVGEAKPNVVKAKKAKKRK